MGVVIGVSGPLRAAAVSTAISMVLGLWLAWLLVNRQFPGRRELGGLATGFLALPAPVVCWYLFIGRATGWPPGMLIAAVLAALPMVVRAGRTAFGSLDPLYANAARSLGSSDWRVFWRVEFPLMWRAAATAAALAFARVLAESVAAVLIAARLAR